MNNSNLVTRKCCYPTPHWHPIICLVPHHPMSGTLPVSGIPPLSGTPFPCLEFHPHVWTPHSHVWNSIPISGPHIPSLAPHHLSGTPSSHVWNPTCVWYPTPVWNPIPMSGIPSPYLDPTFPCLEFHPHIWTPHPHVWNPIPMSGIPSLVQNSIPCLESHPHVWNPISCLDMSGIPFLSGTPSPCLEPHPQSGTPSLVWNPIPTQCPHPTPSAPTPPPVPPPYHLAPTPLSCPQYPFLHLVLATPVWPITALYPPDLAPGCPHPELLPPAALLLPPAPTLSNIITKGPLHLKRKFGFSEFSKFFDVHFNLTSHGFNLTSCNNIFYLTWKKFPKY